jgi:hypothetical protein
LDRPFKTANPEPYNVTAEEIFNYFMFNFNRFTKTRAPFGIHQHVYWFLNNEPILQGFLQFLDYLATLDYVYIVPISKAIKRYLKSNALTGSLFNDFQMTGHRMDEKPYDVESDEE